MGREGMGTERREGRKGREVRRVGVGRRADQFMRHDGEVDK